MKLIREGINKLYHFTDIYNLPTIAKYGILTKKELEQREALHKIKTGGNSLSKSLDFRRENWDKVSLSWCPKIPMVYYREQEQHLCYLVLSLELALLDGIYFTDANATDNDHMRDTGLEGLNLVDFNSVRHDYPYPNQEIKRKKQAEVLIPFSIKTQSIEQVSFRSESSLKEAKRKCRTFSDFTRKFNLDESLFIFSSSYTKNHVVTNLKPTEYELINWHPKHTNRFRLHEVLYVVLELGKVTNNTELLVHVYGTPLEKEIIRGGGNMVYYKEVNNAHSGNFKIDSYIEGQRGIIHQFREEIEIVENED